ncbi:MAG: YgjV family protein [Oscillospiraceae bacterium]|nr:YgjV family protein [Oscillospiraceae bacterium]
MNYLGLIVGNLCSILAMITDSISATRKTPKGVLMVQNLSQLFYVIGAIALKGYSSAVQNVVSVLRNLAAIRKIESKALEWTLVAMGVVLGILFNNLGLVGYLPVIANLQYTLVVFRCGENERALKISFMIAVVMFVVFNLFIYNFAGAVLNFAVFVTTATALLKKKK